MGPEAAVKTPAGKAAAPAAAPFKARPGRSRILAGLAASAHIGPSIHIKGKISAQEPLTIAGHVTGTIDVKGHPVVVTDSAKVAADIIAHTIVIGGNVHGHLTADGRVVLHKTATFEGDLSAPALSVDDGALLHGRLEILGRK